MFKLPLGEDNEGTLPKGMSQQLNALLVMFKQNYPPPKVPISDLQNKFVSVSMAGAALTHAAMGQVHTMFLCPDESKADALDINLVHGFTRESAPEVHADLIRYVKERGFVVFVDEVYFVGLNREEFEAAKAAAEQSKSLDDLAQKREGILVRLMTQEFELAWINELIDSKLTRWRVFMDTRDENFKSLPLDLPLTMVAMRKDALKPDAPTNSEDQSFAM